MIVVVLANNLDSFSLWNIGTEQTSKVAMIALSGRNWCVFNETYKVSGVFNVGLLFLSNRL